MRVLLRLIALLCIASIIDPDAGSAASTIAEQPKNEIQTLLHAKGLRVAGQSLLIKDLRAFYNLFGNKPIWFRKHVLIRDAKPFLFALMAAHQHGLNPQDYHPALIRGRLAERRLNARTELLLTDALLRYITDMKAGRNLAKAMVPAHYAYSRDVDSIVLLARALADRAPSVFLENMAPSHPEYQRLKTALARYRAMPPGGGFTKILDGPLLKPGVSDVRMANLRKRLRQEEINPGNSLSSAYDVGLVQGIKEFQVRYGLEADGMVGPATFAALNMPVEEKIRRIIIAMERWRWLPDNLGARHIRVNIADFNVKVFDGEERVLDMKAIVGKPYRQTPEFSSEITNVIFHPFWHVPTAIARDMVLPRLKENPALLKSMAFDVLQKKPGGSWRTVPSESIDWNTIVPDAFPYLLRQRPGPENVLGRVKFEIRNNDNIYLHGTSEPQLFDRIDRAYSSGCIRVEDPLGMAFFALQDVEEYDKERIEMLYNRDDDAKPKSVKVTLPHPLPIHLFYMTSWVDDAGQMHFRDDIYGRDASLQQALGYLPGPRQLSEREE